jgi:hypothetical protein
MIMTEQEDSATKSSVYWIQVNKEINTSAYTTIHLMSSQLVVSDI